MNTADWLYEFRRFPHVTWINLDENLAALAAEIAIHHRLRSSDAVDVAVARRFATLWSRWTLNDWNESKRSSR
jgi:predicted nucleic acid-binding protein